MRKLFSTLLALTLIVSATSILAISASAYEYVESDCFYIYKGGGPAVSNRFSKKWDEKRAPMYTRVARNDDSSITWLASETVYWRGRSETLARATELGASSVRVERDLPYLSGYGARLTEYTMAAEYADSNPYTQLDLIISWVA